MLLLVMLPVLLLLKMNLVVFRTSLADVVVMLMILMSHQPHQYHQQHHLQRPKGHQVHFQQQENLQHHEEQQKRPHQPQPPHVSPKGSKTSFKPVGGLGIGARLQVLFGEKTSSDPLFAPKTSLSNSGWPQPTPGIVCQEGLGIGVGLQASLSKGLRLVRV